MNSDAATSSERAPCVAGHGVVLDEVRVDGIRAVSVVHPPGLAIDRHAHDLAKLAVLVARESCCSRNWCVLRGWASWRGWWVYIRCT